MSMMDMLPEYETPLPNGFGTGKKIKRGINLIERICPKCGERFVFRRGQTAYIRQVRGRTIRFCSWSCKCENERQNATPKRGGCTKSITEKVRERCAKIVRDKEQLSAGGLTEKERRRIVNRLQRLQKEVKALVEEQAYENSGSVRGIAGGDD